MNKLLDWLIELRCDHSFQPKFWVGNSDVRPFQVQICRWCTKQRYTYQD